MARTTRTRRLFARIRAAAARASKVVAILQDLSGPKIRTGRLKGGLPVELQDGATIRIEAGDGEGDAEHIYTTFEELIRSVRPGGTLLIDDGKIELRVERADARQIVAKVINGGPLGEHKGINAPGVDLGARCADTERHRRSPLWREAWRGHGGAELCPQRRRSARGAVGDERHRRPGHAAGGEAGAPGGAAASRRDSEGLAGRDGGARRSGAGDSARESAHVAEGNYPPRAEGRRAGDCGHAGAGVDADGAAAHARGSQRCRKRRGRRGGRDHAGGRNGRGHVSREDGGDARRDHP